MKDVAKPNPPWTLDLMSRLVANAEAHVSGGTPILRTALEHIERVLVDPQGWVVAGAATESNAS